ncbi:uncharacterized protein BXZ73DRAFT_43852 [Epithele typhae]|uniref:uncharacterized protein n=1 Tax=Epithele typhae TaxID=378194 RepID=UPI002008855B|nr:uncharacterized protein BXZ73DRAFT_43852 [Epithele typhae]KAH9939342.1 hypothetical protein BXZ73DRAFT_43852 [Epithele typhae]
MRPDERSWRDRLRTQDENWQRVFPYVKAAYLRWKYGVPRRQEERKRAAPEEDTPSEEEAPPEQHTIVCVDLYSLRKNVTVEVSSGQWTLEALALAGYLGNTPVGPLLAISFETLELFRCLKLVKASFSTEAFAKLICYKYYMVYRRHYRTALADAFDIYLEVLDDVDAEIQQRLGRGDPNWRPRFGCPPCGYKLEGEAPLRFERMGSMDANNSLKRLLRKYRMVGDRRHYKNTYYLGPPFVDQFANQVPARQAQPKPTVDLRDDGDDVDAIEPAPEPVPGPADTEGDPTDGEAGAPSPCATNWKAAAADEKKHMWGGFDETGIFASACRHGRILWVADMIRSGELAKYGIAMVDKINTELPGNILLGYDIGCVFQGTLACSSAGPEFRRRGSLCIVNAFHGYSHSYICQLHHHPNVITGAGIEDLETMERIFSGSNALASIIRYASKYRRHSLIVLYFRRWDEEKYTNLAVFLRNNFQQAMKIIEESEEFLITVLPRLQLTEAQLIEAAEEERLYFATLRDENPDDEWALSYVERLEDLRGAGAGTRAGASAGAGGSSSSDGSGISFQVPYTGPITDYNAHARETRRTESTNRVLRKRINDLDQELAEIEDTWNMTRWLPTDTRYTKAKAYMATRRYHQALGKLQRLVIQRLFELHKLHLAQTGYKMRSHIAKNMQKRSAAIRRAIATYNKAAAVLQKPLVDWNQVSHYSFVREFALLHGSWNDVSGKTWARPEVREAIGTWRRLQRAREEIQIVYRDARRLHTHIRDEQQDFAAVLKQLEQSDDILYGPTLDFVRHREAANAYNLAFLEDLHKDPRFEGEKTPGRREGREATPEQSIPRISPDPSAIEVEVGIEGTYDDEAQAQAGALLDYIAQ